MTSLGAGFALLLIVLGGFAMYLSYGMLSDCLSLGQSPTCWDPRDPGALGLYIGAVFAASGVVIFFAGNISRLVDKLRGGPDSQP